MLSTPANAMGAADRKPNAVLPPQVAVILPGLLLTGIIAAAAFTLRHTPGLSIFSPMILAVVIGILFSNLIGAPAHTKPGIAFSQRPLLRFAIILLGFQLSVGQVMSIGVGGLAAIAAALVATFAFTVMLGRALGVDRGLTTLIAAGTSICGASAIVAVNSVARGRDEDVAYSVAAITLFGTVAMLSFPVLAPLLGLDQQAFGLWAGSAIHEVAQVVGASFQYGAQAGEIGTVAKLARVAMLAPMVLALGFLMTSRGGGEGDAARPPVPWFVFGFIAVVVFNSVVTVPAEIKAVLTLTTTSLLTVGLAAMGLQTNISHIRSCGLRPLMLALSSFVFIAVFSLALIKLAG